MKKKILVDLCVESDGLMFKELCEQLVERGHQVLLTARRKIQATDLFKWEGLKPHMIGEYGTNLVSKLIASGQRTRLLAEEVFEHLGGLDAAVSNTGIEASRVGFGFNAQVHTFHDHPQAVHQAKLTLPLSTYVYAPWVISRLYYDRFGLLDHQVISYKGFLHMAWMPDLKINDHIMRDLGIASNRVAVFRESETGAAYLFGQKDITLPAIKRLADEMPHVQFVARPRYSGPDLEEYFSESPNVLILNEPMDLQSLIAKADLLIGGGATMSLEAAYHGTPVITCRPIEAPITDWLMKEKLAWGAESTHDIVHLAKQLMGRRTEKAAQKHFPEMEFPLETLIKNIEEGRKP